MNKTKIIVLIAIVLLGLVATFAVGYSNDTQSFKMTLGDGNNAKQLVGKRVVDFVQYIEIPIAIEIPRLGGCNTQIKHYQLTMTGQVHVYYNMDTGESYLKLEETRYVITIGQEGCLLDVFHGTTATPNPTN